MPYGYYSHHIGHEAEREGTQRYEISSNGNFSNQYDEDDLDVDFTDDIGDYMRDVQANILRF